jgi:predicted DsbA family dithiol-disulfide isomerase|tara:strand:+ start:132 stop:692 length:561 start_codon:yes stop_codon:yes gene_type:complete
VRIENLKNKFYIETKLVHFPLHPDTPAEGITMKDLFAGRDYDPEASHARMKILMEKEGLPYGNRTYTYNSRLAQELASWADTQLGGDAIHDLLYTAYFIEEKNISNIAVLLEISEKAGLSTASAREVLEKRSYKEIVDSDWAKSRQYGVTGVPTFVANGYGLVGAQPYESLEELIIKSGAQVRTVG